ncbi:intracellular coagulation inhibitor 3 [Tachypleus tridentatus]|uniref:intracellular coagulation inhibitor 3 n=1 Tax=Tachypleus tridentatus TaxID=6853 RepID=UPI003FD3C0AD
MKTLIFTLSSLQLIFLPQLSLGNYLLDEILHLSDVDQQQLSAVTRITNASNYFGFDLYNTLKGSGNVLISPYSLSCAMAMVYLGSRGVTEREMHSVLNYGSFGLTRDDVRLGFQQAINTLTSNTIGYTLDTANALLIQRSFEVQEDFRQKIETDFGAEVREVDFQSQTTLVQQAINTWTAQKTQNNIQNILKEPPDSNTLLFFLNAVYFKGFWETTFDPKQSTIMKFYNNGSVSTDTVMMMMESRLPFGYVESLNCLALEMPYQGRNVTMLLLLPVSPNGLPELEQALSPASISLIDSTLRKRRVKVFIPKFKLEEEYEEVLKEGLSDMGMKSLFGFNANLNGITEDTGLYVTTVVHKTSIEVDEEGTVASAASGVGGGWRSATPRFMANHPFLFFIRHSETGAVLFMGRVSQL